MKLCKFKHSSLFTSSLSPEGMDGGTAFLWFQCVTQHGLNEIRTTQKL